MNSAGGGGVLKSARQPTLNGSAMNENAQPASRQVEEMKNQTGGTVSTLA